MASYEEVVKEDAPEVFLRLAEASGTTAADATRFGRDFTHAGSPTLDQTGLVDKAVSYDGSNDETTYSVNMPITGYPFTAEAILQSPGTTSTSTEYGRVDLGDASADTDGAYIALFADGSNNLNVRVECESGGTEDTADFMVPNALKGEPIHVVAQYVSATERNVYANGVLIGTDTTSISFPANLDKFAIGNVARSTSDFVAGVVAEPCWYNYKLSAERIRIHHAVSRGRVNTDRYAYAVLKEGPGLYAELGGASGNATDDSGFKRDLTVEGAPTREQTSPLSETGGADATTFDGTDDAFSLAGDDLDITGYPVVVQGYLKSPASLANNTSYCRVMFGDDATEDNYFGIDLTTDGSGNLQARGLLETGGTADHITGSPALSADQFYHVTFRCVSATERYLEINGVQTDSDTTSRTFGSNVNDVVIGRDLASSANFYAGTIGQVAIYGRDIGGSAVRNQYAKAKQYLGNDHRTHTLAKCPLAYYRMGEASGTSAANETEFIAAGTYAGTGPTLGATGALVDDADTAVEFNGTDDQMTAPLPSVSKYPITVEALVKLPSSISANSNYIIIGLTDANGTMKMVAGLKTDSNTQLQAFLAETGTSTATINNACGGAVGNYHHLVAEFISDTSRKVWLNGLELEEETTSVSLSLANLDTICVGVEDLGTDAWYAGYADEVVIYQRQLSTDEKRDQYLSGLGYFNSPTLGGDDSGYIQILLGDAPSLLWPLNETSGSTAADASRWGRDGTYSGGFTLDQSGPNSNLKAVDFDGTDGWATYNGTNDMPIDSYPFTLEAWLRSDTTALNDGAMFSTGDAGGIDDYNFILAAADGTNIFAYGRVWTSDSQGDMKQNSGTGIAAQNDKWLHIVMVCASSTDRKLYVQGRLSVTDTSSHGFPSSQETITVGGINRSSSLFKDGTVGYAAAYKYALSAAQVRAHFIAGRGIFEADNPYLYTVGQLAPAVHFRFNEASGAPADLLGLRDLTKEGAPTQSDSGGPLAKVDSDGSIQFDGTDDAAAVADDAQVTAYPIAIYGWARTPAAPGASAVFSQGGMGDDGTGNNGAQVALQTDVSSNVTASGLFKTGGTTDDINPSAPILEADVWHFVMLVLRSATERELYVNGAPLSTETTSRTFPSSMDDIVFGRNFASSPTFRAGYFAEGGALVSDVSDSEALDLYLAAFEARGVVPLGEVSVTGDIETVIEMLGPKGLSFATLGSGGDIGFQVRVEIAGSVSKDFRNVQTFHGAIGIIAELDSVVSATITRAREGQIDVVAEFSSPVTFEQLKAGRIDAIVEMASTKAEGDTPVTDQDIGQAIGVVAPYIEYGATAPVPPNGRRQ